MEEKSFVRAVAVGGPFLKGNTFVIGSLEDQITWNGFPILLNQTNSGFELHEGVSVKATRGEHSTNVAVPWMESAGVNFEFPMSVNLIVNRLQHHLNVAITMTPQKGGQGGLCGNFNGISADDSLVFSSMRSSVDVPPSESLFQGTTFA